MSVLDDRVIGNKTSPFRILRDSPQSYPQLEDNYVIALESPRIFGIANYSPMTFKFIMNSNS
jgi:hypothetical protein